MDNPWYNICHSRVVVYLFYGYNFIFTPQKLKKDLHSSETHGEKTNGEKGNGEKTNGEKTNGEKTNGEKTNGEKHEDSPPPVKKQTDSGLVDIEAAIPDTTMDQKVIDRVLDKTRCVHLQTVTDRSINISTWYLSA